MSEPRVKGVVEGLFSVDGRVSWSVRINDLRSKFSVPFKCAVCGKIHKSLDSNSAIVCIKKTRGKYKDYEFSIDLPAEVVWECARRGIGKLPKPASYERSFWENWMISVDPSVLDEIYSDFLVECSLEAKRIEEEWFNEARALMEKVFDSDVVVKPLIEVRRGKFGEIVSLKVNYIPIDVEWLVGYAVDKSGLPKRYAKLDDKGRGEALNYSLYAVDPYRNLVVIQQRKYYKACRRWYPNIKKNYYLIRLSDGLRITIPPMLRSEIERLELSQDALIPPRLTALVDSL